MGSFCTVVCCCCFAIRFFSVWYSFLTSYLSTSVSWPVSAHPKTTPFPRLVVFLFLQASWNGLSCFRDSAFQQFSCAWESFQKHSWGGELIPTEDVAMGPRESRTNPPDSERGCTRRGKLGHRRPEGMQHERLWRPHTLAPLGGWLCPGCMQRF